ncbi:MAG: ABC transporter permease [Candidatus Afipia apatlaquensis]|uniref:ABC transporter permease n=1 Tax=Candidatus Afipia apatlaquensis TaxID=2712852 RepID=A0A7C9RFC4_9BRAD|nr:ABC transporter permease [Candidatus Afipia apatlaquensis]
MAEQAQQRGLLISPWLLILLGQIALTVGFLGLWEIAIRAEWLPVYLYGQPSGIAKKFVTLLSDGTLLQSTLVTGLESLIGFVIGCFFGSVAGLGLWLTPRLALMLRPFIVAANGLPKIALAPLIIVWFGIGIESKIAIAAIITFIVSLMTAYSGAQEVDQDLIRLMRSLGATRWQTFRKIVAPATMPWIISGLRLNVGFALIGAVVGEYIAAKQGLGYLVYYAGTLYDLNAVWVGLFALMLLALVLDYSVTLLERWLSY